MLLLRPLAGRAIRWLEREGQLEHGTTSAVVVLTLACGAATQALGIHAIFGAFVAGLIVAELPRIKEATLESIDSMVIGVFAPVFFAYSGLKVEALTLPGWPITSLVLGGAIFGKVIGAGLGARAGGMNWREALAVGIGVSARGSTELVVARIGLDLGVLAAPMYALIMLVPMVTSLATPVLLRLAIRGIPPRGDEERRLAEEASEERAIIRRRGTKILVPTSGDPHSVQALRFAAPLARLPGATLVGLSVITPARRGRRGVGSAGRTEEEVIATSEAVAREFELPDFHTSVVTAPSVDEAVTAEAARGYDLVFLGLNRARALSHRLLRALLASGHCDVVLVRAAPAWHPFRRILLPVNGALPSRGAAELAFLYARETGSQLQILHVIEPAAAPGRRALAELRLLGARMLEELVERGRREAVDVRCRIVSSRYPARAILDAAIAEPADLVLLGAAPRYVHPRAFFGPTSDLLLAHSPCAVAIYVGGIRPEAFRAATPEPSPVTHSSERAAAPEEGGAAQL